MKKVSIPVLVGAVCAIVLLLVPGARDIACGIGWPLGG